MKKLLLVGLVLGVAAPAVAFDTYWHTAASAGAAGHFKFSADATNILQFGTFGPDLFGPMYDHGTVKLEKFERMANDFVGLRDKATGVRSAAQFMHFDNLSAEVDRNWKFDYLWIRLLDNTRSVIDGFAADDKLNEGTRKLLTLVTLGSSLHVIEDFYAHTDWTHQDWVKLGFPQQTSEWGKGNDYAPSWFTVREKLGPPSLSGPENWPFVVSSGQYPAPATAPKSPLGVPMTHDDFNHDNSELFYEGASRISFHGFGAHPATDAASAKQHQLYAVSSAAMAAVQWVELVQKDEKAHAAIWQAKDWDLQKFNPAMQKDLTNGLEFILLVSCLAGKWDGDHPINSNCKITNQLNSIVIPTVFNEFWSSYLQYNILEKLTKGIGGTSGHYAFDKDWLRAHQAQP